jgi:hypothetical protein
MNGLEPAYEIFCDFSRCGVEFVDHCAVDEERNAISDRDAA